MTTIINNQQYSQLIANARYALRNASGQEHANVKAAGDLGRSISDAVFVAGLFLSSLSGSGRRSKTVGAFIVVFCSLLVVVVLNAACRFEQSNCSNFEVSQSALRIGVIFFFIFLSSLLLKMAEYVMRSIILIFTIVSINYHVTQFRQWLSDILPPIAATTVIAYSKLSAYETFRWGFLAYLVVPTLVVVAQATLLSSWEFAWCVELLGHLAKLVVFVPVASALSPHTTQALSRPFR